jgi:hypothetical protein
MLKILTVAGLATFEIYVAIPTGFAMGLNPWVIFFASLAGGSPEAENGKGGKERPPGYDHRREKLLGDAAAAYRDLKRAGAC